MKNVTLKKITVLFITLIAVQFFILLMNDGGNKSELEKASEELRHEFQNSDKSLDEKAEILYLKQLENRIIAANLRDLNTDDKPIYVYHLSNEIEKLEVSNPDEAAKLKHQLEILKAGHSPISYFMEKILSLRSLHFLTYQKNYFFIILTSINYIILLISIYLIKNRQKKL